MFSETTFYLCYNRSDERNAFTCCNQRLEFNSSYLFCSEIRDTCKFSDIVRNK